jgi:MarR family transcriptional regulator, transcriptional regulator for hemolysin
MQAHPTSAQARPDRGAALRAASDQPPSAQLPSEEPTLDQLLAEPIVQQLMRSDRTDEAAIRHLVQETAAARLALQAHSGSSTDDSDTDDSSRNDSGTDDPQAIVRLLHETARLWSRHYDREVRTRFPGMTRARCAVLRHLAQYQGVNQVTLAGILDIRPISLVRLLDRLEAAGFVVRRPHPDDRRVHVLGLTAKAAPIVERIDGLTRKIYDDLQLGISKAEASQLHALLFRIGSKLAGRPGEKSSSEPLRPRRHA